MRRIVAIAGVLVFVAVTAVPAKDKVSKFSRAVAAGDYVLVLAMLEANPKLVRIRDHGLTAFHSQMTPLHWAAMFGRVRIAGLLLKCGADPNAGDVARTTPLMYAAVRGLIGVARVLLAHGAKINRRNYDRRTATAIALMAGHTKMADFLISRGGIE